MKCLPLFYPDKILKGPCHYGEELCPVCDFLTIEGVKMLLSVISWYVQRGVEIHSIEHDPTLTKVKYCLFAFCLSNSPRNAKNTLPWGEG